MGNTVISVGQTGGITANTVNTGDVMEKHDIGWAIAQMKQGKRVRRTGWNGKTQWVCFMPPMVVPSEQVNTRTRKFVPDGDLHCGGYFVIYSEPKPADPNPKVGSTEDGRRTWQPGWAPSTGDAQAEDWELHLHSWE
jgi:hypothetical protein